MSKRVDQQTTKKLPTIKTKLKSKATPVAIATAISIAFVLCALCLVTCTGTPAPTPANTNVSHNVSAVAKQPDKTNESAGEKQTGESSTGTPEANESETPRTNDSAQEGSQDQSQSTSAPSQEPEQAQAQPPAAGHTHNWTDKTERNWVEDSPAYDEPVYETYYEQRRVGTKAVCNGCGFEAGSGTEMSTHMKQTGCVGYHTEGVYESVPVTVQAGTIHHDATGHWDVRTYSVCTGCGQTK